jgi:2,4-dihydroxyhept-2-ene-1,7-dioic acid aldolase
MTDARRLRECWAAGATAIGGWSVSADPLVAEVIGAADLDVVCVDAQHGWVDTATLPGLLQAMRAVGRTPLVRPRWNDPGQIMRVLDAGASGVVVPMIDDAAQAAAAASACRFPPEGIRSWGPLWSARGVQSPTQANEAILCVLMVETAGAVANLEQILATPGLDAIYVGPNDLALSCGLGRQTYRTSSEVASLLDRIVVAAHQVGIPVGMHCSDAAMAADWRDRGVDWVTALTDLDVLSSGVHDVVMGLR